MAAAISPAIVCLHRRLCFQYCCRMTKINTIRTLQGVSRIWKLRKLNSVCSNVGLVGSSRLFKSCSAQAQAKREGYVDSDCIDSIAWNEFPDYKSEGNDFKSVDYGINETTWSKKAVEIANDVLLDDEFGGTLKLYSISVDTKYERIHAVLDHLNSKTGSPVLEDIMSFSTLYRRAWDDALSQQEEGMTLKKPLSLLPSDFELTTSSPGAERDIRGIEDLKRFREMPMRVVYNFAIEDGNKIEAEKDEVLQMIWISGDENEPHVKLPNDSNIDFSYSNPLVCSKRQVQPSERQASTQS